MRTLVHRYLATIVRPGRTFEELSEQGALGPSLAVVLFSALTYSAFVLWMYLAGHQPSFTGNPIPAADYYLWQAAFLPPWLLLAWAVSASAGHGLARAFGSSAQWRATAAPLGFALALPLTWTYVIPEVVVFGVSGHDALVAAMRITGPLTLIWWSVLCWKAVTAVHDHSVVARAAIAFVTLLVFVGVMALLIR